MTGLLLVLGIVWQAVRPGVWQGEISMGRSGLLSVVRATVIRMDPRRLAFSLERVTTEYGLGAAWTIDSIPDDGVVAFNAGQFIGGIPWGWLVQDGVESQPPGSGTLAMAFVVDAAGAVALLSPDALPNARARTWVGFQSFPALLVEDGVVPWELRAKGRGVDLEHRDSRLALCIATDGSILVALTRFKGPGRFAETLPIGPTVPEMAAFMRSLGCVRAMLLDGGISAQLAVRERSGALRRWPNWRAVPLALVARAQPDVGKAKPLPRP